MTQEMKHTLANGRYNARTKTITLASGHVITAKELIQFKKERLSNAEIIARLEKKHIAAMAAETAVTVEEPKVEAVKHSTSNWASVSQDDIAAASFLKKEPKRQPWFKRLFKGGGK